MKRTLVLAVVIAVALGVSPTVAQTVARYARNSDKVDGFHAVGASTRDRGGKLVATGRRGFLPDGIVRSVPHAAAADDAATLQGHEASVFFLRACSTTYAFAHIDPAELMDGVADVVGNDCAGNSVRALRLGTGEYSIRLVGGRSWACDIVYPDPVDVAAIVGFNDRRVLTATYREAPGPKDGCESITDSYSGIEVFVSVKDASGTPTDAIFTIAVHSISFPN